MLKFFKNTKKFLVIVMILSTMTSLSPILSLAETSDGSEPIITQKQPSGQVQAGSEIIFNIKDDTRVLFILYGWNRRIDNNPTDYIKLDTATTDYDFKVQVPTEPGLYEFSIAAQDSNGNITDWMNIPYIVVENVTGLNDTTKPTFIFNVPDEYPGYGQTIEQEKPITVRVEDESGVYYIAYKWVREIETSYSSGATFVYNTNTLNITAPKDTGVWYLQLYARDGSNNISTGYTTQVIIEDIIAPTLTLNGSSEMDVPLNGTFEDPGATFSDNYDATKIIYANETIDTSKVGTQVLTYTAVDGSGNASNTVIRTVTVVGTEKVYELTAPTKTEYYINDTIDLAGASIKVTDERGNVSYVTPTEDMFEDFSTTTPNIKQILFTYNGTSIIYEYNVNDYITGIKVTSPNKVEYEYLEELDIEGGYVQTVMASGIESLKEYLTLDMISGYDNAKLGEQLVIVNYAGKQTTFKVTVKDSTKPVITLNGESIQIIKKGEVYNELGVTISDNYDTNLTPVIDAKEVNTDVPGIYSVIYNVMDNSGNIADTVIRKVHIVDYSALETRLSEIVSLIETDYTQESWENLENIKNQARLMIETNLSIQTQIDVQLINLNTAIDNLQAVVVNQEALTEYVKQFVSTDYTNWAEFEVLVNAAKDITDLQSKFDAKLQVVQAFRLVEKEINTTELDAIKAELDELEESDYTAESWEVIQNKIATAEEQELQSKFNEVVAGIKLDTLVAKTVDTSAVDNYVDTLVETDYTNWADFTAKVEDVKSEELQSKFDARVSEVTGFKLPKKVVDTHAEHT